MSTGLCSGCGAELPPARRRGNPRKWCSETCRVRYWRTNVQPTYTQDYHRATFTPAPPRKWCGQCGAAVANRSDTKFCTRTIECRRAAKREGATANVQARRARLAGVDYERFKSVEIFERDGWTCGICGGHVDRSLRWPDPASPTLDHVVPLKLGGPHTRSNTQLAHWRCNGKKGIRILDAQEAS